MAEFQEIIKQFRRMCWYYQRQVKCDGCPMAGCDISQCRKLAFDRPDDTEIIVTKWAAEHPETVYPSWHDYLHSIGILYDKHTAGGDVTEIHWGNVMTPIPADIAEKLGLQPKEG